MKTGPNYKDNHCDCGECEFCKQAGSFALTALLPCPFCGGEVRWCGRGPDDPHDCDQITCPNCEINFDCHNDQTQYACNLESGRIETANVWNRRAK